MESRFRGRAQYVMTSDELQPREVGGREIRVARHHVELHRRSEHVIDALYIDAAFYAGAMDEFSNHTIDCLEGMRSAGVAWHPESMDGSTGLRRAR